MKANLQKEWKENFTSKAKQVSKSSKANFTFKNAVDCSLGFRDAVDELMIDYFEFVENSPLKDNDYFKYVMSYQKWKKLNPKYFRHSSEKLKEYYKKVDENKSAVFSLEDYTSIRHVMVKLD